MDDNLSVYNIINCDEYLIEEKEIFLQFIKNKANTEYKTFPIVFFNRIFIGGLAESIEFIKQNLFNCI